jgi:hypothetical protein
MYARVVRFTGVTSDRIAEITARVKEAEGPPEGVDSTGMKLLFDESQGTAVFIGFFATEADMRRSAEVLENMDASDTPGTRASVDHCSIAVEADS